MQHILLNPGPVNVSERVRAALSRGDACHREPEIAETLASARALLKELFDPTDAYHVAFVTGSGTSAMEMAFSSTPAEGAKMLVIENGVYGERISKICAAHRIDFVKVTDPWESLPDLGKIEATLKDDPAIDTVGLVHHETTTGMINPVQAVGALAKKYRKRFVLDTVSGLGGEELDLDAWGVDVAASTANKCICGFPGISFVLCRKELMEEIAKQPPRSLYLNLAHNWSAQRDSCGAFTPAIQILWALEEALKELREEGVQNRIARYARVSKTIRDGIEQLGCKMYLPREVYSNTISSFDLPAGKTYEQLHDALKERGFVIYAGQGPLASKVFRIANMGQVSDDDYARLLKELEALLA